MNEDDSNKSMWDLYCENFLDPLWEDHVSWESLIDGTFLDSLSEGDEPRILVVEDRPVPPTDPKLLKGL